MNEADRSKWLAGITVLAIIGFDTIGIPSTLFIVGSFLGGFLLGNWREYQEFKRLTLR